MELILVVFGLSILFSIGYIVGAKQENKRIRKEGFYYDMENTGSYFPYPIPTAPTSSVEEVPAELLMGGDIERTLHIAGVKEATPTKLAEWENERRTKVETKTELSMDGLLSKLNPDDMKLKAGIVPHDRTEETIDLSKKMMSKVKVDDIDETELTKLRARVAMKQFELDRENQFKIDFEALNFSRISNEARKQISEIVRLDLENKIRNIEKNTPEINDTPKPKNKRSEKKTKNTKSTPHKL
jgi:hypothetical protein